MTKRILTLLLIATTCLGAEVYLGKISDLTWTGSGTEFYSSFVAQGWADTNTYTALWEMETTNATQTLDTSGNGYNASNMPSVAAGAVYTIVGTNQYGRVEHGYTFDGTDDAFEFKPADWNSTATSGTINAWVYPTASGADNVIFSTADEASATRWMSIQYNYYTAISQDFNLYLRNNDTLTQAFIAKRGTINTNWTMITFVSDGSDYTAYVNGIQTTFFSTAGTQGRWFDDVTGRDNVRIGDLKRSDGAIASFAGQMGGVSVLNYAMSSNAIYTLYQNTHPTNNVRIR